MRSWFRPKPENQGDGQDNRSQASTSGKYQRPTPTIEYKLNNGIEEAEKRGKNPDTPGTKGNIPAGFGTDQLGPLREVSRQGNEGHSRLTEIGTGDNEFR